MPSSNLSPVSLIAENSEATPGLFNAIISTLSSNIDAMNSNITLQLAAGSGNTLSVLTNLNVRGQIQAQGLSIGSTPPSYVTTAGLIIGVNSSFSDYLYLADTSDQRSDYILGSRAGGTADGLNLWDVSGATVIVSFSKQSVRFYQNVVGPVFDVGGALASTYNAATFGTGSQSTESRIQSAINQAAIDNIARVYVPANMFPYSASSISFIDTVQLVREGGDWGWFDILAYGAYANGTRSSTSAIQAAMNGAGRAIVGQPATVYVPSGSFALTSNLSSPGGRGIDLIGQGRGVSIISATTSGFDGWDISSNARMANITLRGSGTSVNAAYSALDSGAAKFIVVENCTIELWPGSGINTGDSSSDWVIRNNTFQKNANVGVFLASNTSRCVVLGNFISLNSSQGVDCNGSYNVIANNIVDSNGTNGGAQDTWGILIAGVAESSADHNLVIGNVVSYTGAQGITVRSNGTRTANFNLIVGNRSSFNTSASKNGTGIAIDGTSNGTLNDNAIIGNLCTGNQVDGIRVDGSVSNTSVRRTLVVDNVCTSNGTGIVVAGPNAFDTIVVNNVVLGSTTTDLWIGNSDVRTTRVGNKVRQSDSSYDAQNFSAVASVLGLLDGVAGTPSLNFSSETSLGIYRSIASTIAQSYGTYVAQFLEATTNILIGPTSGTNSRLRTASGAPAALESVTADLGAYYPIRGSAFYAAVAGTNLLPEYSFSETSLGFYKSASSTVALSYGTFRAQGNVVADTHLLLGNPVTSRLRTASGAPVALEIVNGDVSAYYPLRASEHYAANAGTAILPAYSMSEVSLGWYRSGVSTVALSYGTFNLNQARTVSMRTLAASSLTASAANTNTIANECGFTVGGASGASFFINSGGTTYIFNSALSAANA